MRSRFSSGDAREWFDNSATASPRTCGTSIDDKSMSVIRQLLVNRTVYNSDGEEHLVTKDNVAELTDDEIKDIVCDRGNKGDSAEDIYDAISRAADDAYASDMENAYEEGYRKALMSEWGLQEDKTIKWVTVGKKDEKKHKLGIWFPYSTLEEWINKWKEDEYEDDYYGDIHDLAKAYLEKIKPNDEYSGSGDTEYFNEQLADYHLGEIELTPAPKQEDPGQPELPLEGEPEAEGGEIEKPYTVSVGEHPNQNVYKGIPSGEATKYREAMKPQRDDITFRAEAFLAMPFDRLEEAASDVTITFKASDEAAESIVPLLKELKKMGSQGSSRDIKIEDWDGRDRFGFDGDGASKIGDITVNGEVVEKLLENDNVDPKDTLIRWQGQRTTKWQVEFKDEQGLVKHAIVQSDQNVEDGIHMAIRDGAISHRDAGAIYSAKPLTEELLQEAVYKLSTTQIDLPKEIAQHIISWGELNIADDDLYIDEKDGCGRETEQHVTVLYGLTDGTPSEELKHIVESTKPFLIEFGGLSIFENEKYDVIKLDMISEELHNLHLELRRSCPNEYKFPDYKPHCTIAYVQKGKGKKYAGEDVFKAATVARDFWAYDLLFKGAGDSEDAERVVQLIHFDKSKPIEHDEPEAGEQRYPEATREEEPAEEMAVAESHVDAKAFIAQHLPSACPGCKSHNLTDPDDEGLVDCLECGIWFDPFHPENKPVAENDQVDPKQFTQKQDLGLDLRDWVFVDRDEQKKSATYRHKSGRVQFLLSYTGRGKFRVYVTSVPDGSAMSDWEDFPAESHSEAEATAMNLAYDMVHNTDPSLFRPVQENAEVDPKQFVQKVKLSRYVIQSNNPARSGGKGFYNEANKDWVPNIADATVYSSMHGEIMLQDWREALPNIDFELVPIQESDEIDTKSFISKIPHHELQQWEGNGYKCSCGNWRYKLTGWSSSTGYALKEFKAHKRLEKAKETAKLAEAEEINAKEFLSRTTNYRVRMGVGAQTRYLSRDVGSGQLMWKDFDDASIFDTDEAQAMIEQIGETYGGQRVVAELVDDDHLGEAQGGPFEDEGLPGEVTSFLRKVRSKRSKKPKQAMI
jgi:2'-5' RNA ligase